MPSHFGKQKYQAHELIERLAPSQVSAVIAMLRAMLDPVSRSIANAPTDDEPETDQERQAVAESKAWFEQHNGTGIPHEEVLGDFGLKTSIDGANRLAEDRVVRTHSGRCLPLGS